MEKKKIIVGIIGGTPSSPAERTLLESMRDDIIIIDPKDPANQTLGDTILSLRPREPMKIVPPPIIPDNRWIDHFGQSSRRERRKQNRKTIKKKWKR